MNKLLALLFLLASFTLEANSTLEVRGAAFIPTEQRFRDIYGTALPSIQVEGSFAVWRCFYLFANLDDVFGTGHVRDCGKTDINLLSFSLGPKVVYCLNTYLDIYFGIGPVVTWGYVKNFCNDIRSEYNVSGGGIAKVGVNIYVYQNFFLDVFADYQYQHAFRNNVFIGGLRTGLGLGYSF